MPPGEAENNDLQLTDIINQYKNEIITYIRSLKDISEEYQTQINQLILDADVFLNWTDAEPWKKPITIKGQIKGVKSNEKINITLRNITVTLEDKDDGIIDGIIKYELTVPYQPINSEESFFGFYNCNLSIEQVDSNCRKIQTPSLLYYCFSNGTIDTDFIWPPEIRITKPEENSLYIMNRRIMPWFSTRIIGPVTIKVEDTNKDGNNIDYVEFYLDDVLDYTDNESLYEWKWSPYKMHRLKTPFNNKCTIKTIAYDNNGYVVTDSLTLRFISPAEAIGGGIIIGTFLFILLTLFDENE